MKLFVVDDSSDVRARIVAAVEEIPGVAVVGEAADAVTATAFVLRHRPDVVVLDIQMPGGSGFQVLDAVGLFSPPPQVVVLTNHTHDIYRRRCMEAGAGFFFDKSTQFEHAIDAIALLNAAESGSGS